ncbi:MAG: Ig-like domain-containing protein [Melioribacteraceae bacterium]|nr:Ig-like domain-containing protein [Melioribacteraceae bacterium]
MAKKFKIVLFGFFLLYGCANQLPPGGGEIDKIPPVISETYPLDGTTNYNDEYIELTFSEYVDKRTVQESLFFAPSIGNDSEFSWSGTTVRVYFNTELKENTTYTVSIGSDVKDLRNSNKMASPFSIVFSTGDIISKGKITGTVFSNDTEDVFVFAYKIMDEIPGIDSVKPDYISQVGTNGKYLFAGLSEGKYLVLSIIDKIRNQVFDKDEDLYNLSWKPVELENDSVEINNVDFILMKEKTVVKEIVDSSKIAEKDTIAPSIKSFTTKYESNKIDFDSPQFTLDFSEKVISDSLNSFIHISDLKKNNYPYTITTADSIKYEVSFAKIKPKTEFIIKVNLNPIMDLSRNKKDTVITKTISTMNDIDFVTIAGNVENDESNKHPIKIKLTDTKSKTEINSVNLEENKFKLTKVLPGKYFLYAFIDADSNSVYTNGKLSPLVYSEKFILYPDTLKIKSRWSLEDLKIKLPK